LQKEGSRCDHKNLSSLKIELILPISEIKSNARYVQHIFKTQNPTSL